MKRSINEIASTALKAARGAGVPLGHAEEFARAVEVLARRGDVDGLVEAAEALTRPHRTAKLLQEAAECTLQPASAIMAMPIACDLLRAGIGEVRLRDCTEQRLAQAFAVLSAAKVVSSEGDLSVTAAEEMDMPEFSGPCAVPDRAWVIFTEFAAKTFVPETEASRQSGAGAGLTDND